MAFTTENLGEVWKCKVKIVCVKEYDNHTSYIAQTTVLEYSNLLANLLTGTIIKTGSWYSWKNELGSYSRTQNENEVPFIQCEVKFNNSWLLKHTNIGLK